MVFCWSDLYITIAVYTGNKKKYPTIRVKKMVSDHPNYSFLDKEVQTGSCIKYKAIEASLRMVRFLYYKNFLIF